MAARALRRGHVLHHVLAIALALGVLQRVAQPRDHAVEAGPANLLARRPIEQQVLLRLGQVGERLLQLDAVLLRRQLDHAQQVLRGRARPHRAIQQRLRPVGDRLRRVKVVDRAQPVALRARTVAGVEAEAARLQLGHVDAALRARHRRRVQVLLIPSARRLQADEHKAAGDLQCRRARRRQPLGVVITTTVLAGQRLQDDAVHDGFQRVVLALLQPHPLFHLDDLAVDAQPVALLVQRLNLFAELALAPAHHRRQHRNPLPRRVSVALHDLRDDLLCGLPGDRPVAIRTVRLAHARIQQPQVVVDLGDGSDGRTRRARGRLLLDRDRRTQPVDGVHIRPLHLVEELPRIGAQRFDIAPLPLGVDGVKGQRALARPR